VSQVRIGVAQVPQVASLESNLRKVLEFMERAAEQRVELLCFPETHLPGYRVGLSSPDAPCDEETLANALECISARCRDLALGVIVGTETPNPAGKPFNSAVVFDQDGRTLAVHHKSRITPMDAKAYAPGDGPTMFGFRGVPMGVVICFEGFRFPETTRELARRGAKVVFHPQCNHFFTGMEWKLPVHEALLVSRAAENTIYFVSANMSHPRNNCRSLIIGPDGLVIKASELGKETLLTADIEPERATHAFLKDDPQAMMKALAEA
jgi:predicted amidohydrolase